MSVSYAPKAKPLQNLAAQAYGAVSQMIRDRRLEGGHTIVEAKLAEYLGLSRTPLREALQRLEGEGLVVKGAGRSFVVRTVGLGEYIQSLKVREVLEAEAGVSALGRIPLEEIKSVRREIETLFEATPYHTDAHWQSDDNLHELAIVYCGNDVMIKMVRNLRVITRLFEIARLSDRLQPDNSEHLFILDALECGDENKVREAYKTHMRSLKNFALEQLS